MRKFTGSLSVEPSVRDVTVIRLSSTPPSLGRRAENGLGEKLHITIKINTARVLPVETW